MEVLEDQGRLAEAERSFKRTLDLDSDFAAAYSHLGDVLLDQQELAEAESTYLGSLVANQGNLADAERSFRRAVEIEPGFAEAHYNLGLVLQTQGKPDEAEVAFDRARELGGLEEPGRSESGQ